MVLTASRHQPSIPQLTAPASDWSLALPSAVRTRSHTNGISIIAAHLTASPLFSWRSAPIFQCQGQSDGKNQEHPTLVYTRAVRVAEPKCLYAVRTYGTLA